MKKLASTLSLIAAFAFTTHAQLLVEPFTYSDGPLVQAGRPWTTDTGTPGEQSVIGGQLFLDDDESEDTFASLSTAVTSGVVTASFDLRIDGTDGPGSAGGAYFTYFVASTGTAFGRVFTQTSPGGAANDFRIGLSTTATSANATFATPFIEGTTYRLTLSYDFGTDIATLSVPGFGTITSTDAVNVATINRYGFRQAAATGDMFIDNLTVIPEPGTYMLLGIGGLLCAQQFRRRKNKS